MNKQLPADLSPVVAALEDGWRLIQSRHPEVPDATIVVKRDKRALGHTTTEAHWAPAASPDDVARLEVMVSGERLSDGPLAAASTLLHEAAHARNLAAGVKDCDSNQRHNKRFKLSAEALGLTVESNGWHGFAATSLSVEGADDWGALIVLIANGLNSAAVAPRKGGALVARGADAPKREKNLPKAVCSCGHSIRASRTVLEIAAPTCQVCGSAFEVAA